MKKYVTGFVKVALALASLTFLQGCSSHELPGPTTVASAYDDSGTVALNPYTRTIFSSGNF